MAGITFTWKSWNGNAVKQKVRAKIAEGLNEAAADGVTLAQEAAPRDTGFMANTIEQIDRATPAVLSASWGNMTATYTLWQEIGSQGRPGRYFLRNSLMKVQSGLMRRLAGKLR